MDRKAFIRNIARGGAVLFLAPAAIRACSDDPADSDPNGDPNGNGNGNQVTLDLTDQRYTQLGSAGGFAYVGNLIVFNDGNEIIALSSKCTHQGFDVTYNHSAGNLYCPGHGSVFTTGGAVVQGPANSPLPEYAVTREGDTVIIEL